MPNIKQFKKHKDYLKWYRDYREKNREKLRKYQREWQRKDRAKKRELRPKCPTCGRFLPEKLSTEKILTNKTSEL